MWFVCQIGAREHFAIPRALHKREALAGLVTDFWLPPGHFFSSLPGARRLRDRYHPGLDDALVHAPNLRMLGYELWQRSRRRRGWPVTLGRNELFQRAALARLGSASKGAAFATRVADSSLSRLTPMGTDGTARRSVPTLFSYSYAALELFRWAKQQGWQTVLGQIDPGPEEERIVIAEHQRYPQLGSRWKPVPPSYWANWREEIELADRVIVNSEWSRECLIKDGVPSEKMEVIPLVFEEKTEDQETEDRRQEIRDRPGCIEVSPSTIRNQQSAIQNSPSSIQHPSSRIQNSKFKIQNSRALHVLFLGQINLRKGIGRLLDAMRLLKDEKIELTLAGPSEVDAASWADLPQVNWIGPVARSEVSNYYRRADLFILPTLSDGYALTQLEALAYGLPVLASKSCGNAVTHGQNGWILENLEPETIAQALMSARQELPLASVRAPQFSLSDLATRLVEGW